ARRNIASTDYPHLAPLDQNQGLHYNDLHAMRSPRRSENQAITKMTLQKFARSRGESAKFG
ncbi:MAG TPA: hypothetical protein VML91_19455, partial [Burkholderiales bacterium]|nr:hypothetical protein [Burkholderiales bacterium]